MRRPNLSFGQVDPSLRPLVNQLVGILNSFGAFPYDVIPRAGELLIGRSDGTYGLSTLTAGTNISITSESGRITIASAAGVGEANTASNQGIGGVGVFSGKVGVDLQFKNINAGSSAITITDDAGNKEIDIDVNQANLDHGLLGGLADDDHTQYALLAGRAAGQTLKGGTAAGDDLTLWSTNNATKGNIYFGNSGNHTFDEVNGRWGLGAAVPGYTLDLGQTLGKRLALWNNGTIFYGFEIQGSELRSHSAVNDASGFFTWRTNDVETMRLSAGTSGLGVSGVQGASRTDTGFGAYSNSPVRTGGNPWHIKASNAADTKCAIFGWDETNDHGVLGALQHGVAWKNFMVNPNGANLGVGTTTTPDYPLTLGNTLGKKLAYYSTGAAAEFYGVEIQSLEVRNHASLVADSFYSWYTNNANISQLNKEGNELFYGVYKGAYNPNGSYTLSTGTYAVVGDRQELTGSSTATLQGTATLRIV